MTVSCCAPGRGASSPGLWTAGAERLWMSESSPWPTVGKKTRMSAPHLKKWEFCQHCWACKWTFRGGQLDFSQYCWAEVPANEGKDLHLATLRPGILHEAGCMKFEEETHVCHEKGPLRGEACLISSVPSFLLLSWHHLSLLLPWGNVFWTHVVLWMTCLYVINSVWVIKVSWHRTWDQSICMHGAQFRVQKQADTH